MEKDLPLLKAAQWQVSGSLCASSIEKLRIWVLIKIHPSFNRYDLNCLLNILEKWPENFTSYFASY